MVLEYGVVNESSDGPERYWKVFIVVFQFLWAARG